MRPGIWTTGSLLTSASTADAPERTGSRGSGRAVPEPPANWFDATLRKSTAQAVSTVADAAVAGGSVGRAARAGPRSECKRHSPPPRHARKGRLCRPPHGDGVSGTAEVRLPANGKQARNSSPAPTAPSPSSYWRSCQKRTRASWRRSWHAAPRGEQLSSLRTYPTDRLPRRVRAVAQILSDEGYQARVERIKGGFRIVEENCAIREVADRFEQLCEGEFDFLRQAFPDAHVERVSHRVAGDQHT